VDFGAHLPLMDFGGTPYRLEHLASYAKAAARLGFSALAANDHMVFSVPWLDGPTVLAAVVGHSSTMTLATTVSLPVLRGPVPLAKTLATIDRLSGGRLVVGVGPGSSQHDFDAVGIDFAERWARLEESIGALRALWRNGPEPFVGRFYSTEHITLEPVPSHPGGPPIWLGSWGAESGLRRTARLADGWLASAYNTTPAQFGEAWARLQHLLPANGKDPESFPNAVATMWFYITDSRANADRVMQERIAPAINRPQHILRNRLPIGPPELFAEKLSDFARAGVQRVFIWPVADEHHQLELFCEQVRPAITV
jgi:alkanesulfonate monooxygenase SsuD/methylene tetrahydromethanopterin reductase-like flavin-dependent oxidoreductase (luciferase family)